MTSFLSGVAAFIFAALGVHHPAIESGSQSTYTNTTYEFSITLPPGFIASDDGHDASRDGTAIVFARQDTIVQVEITPFDGNLSNEVQVETLGAADNEEPIDVTADVRGLAFFAYGAFGDDTSEIWLVHEGYLYQFASANEDSATLKSIASSIVFD